MPNKYAGVDEEIVLEVRCRVRRLIGKAGWTPDDRDDLEQELVVDVLGALRTFDPARASRRTFLSRVAENRARKLIRARTTSSRDYRRLVGSLDDATLGAGEDNDGPPVSRVARSLITEDGHLSALSVDVREAVAALPDRLRYVCLRFEEAGLAELAREMGRNRARKALRQVRKHFERAGLRGYFEEGGPDSSAPGYIAIRGSRTPSQEEGQRAPERERPERPSAEALEAQSYEGREMPIIASDSGARFTPCPQGTFPAVCVDVIDNGMVTEEYGGEKKQLRKVTLRWQVAEINPETGKRFTAQKRYTLSLNEKANLRKDLETWRGRPFTAEELAGFDLEKLVGANCQLAVTHVQGKKDKSKTYAAVQTIVALGKGMERLEPVDYVREQDRQADAADAEKEPVEEVAVEF